MWPQIAIAFVMMVISSAITAATKPKPEQPKPGTLEIPKNDENRPVPVVFGTVMIKDANVLWTGDSSTKPVTTKAGKK